MNCYTLFILFTLHIYLPVNLNIFLFLQRKIFDMVVKEISIPLISRDFPTLLLGI